MRNPSLVYRNSNELIGQKVTYSGGKDTGKEESVLNEKCLPYLMREYGFHTVM